MAPPPDVLPKRTEERIDVEAACGLAPRVSRHLLHAASLCYGPGCPPDGDLGRSPKARRRGITCMVRGMLGLDWQSPLMRCVCVC